MPRLRHKLTGVTVNVDDETAARLGGSYESADKPAAKKATSKRTSSKKS